MTLFYETGIFERGKLFFRLEFLIKSMRSLEALWVIVPPSSIPDFELHTDRSLVVSCLLRDLSKCGPRLRYIRIGKRSWRVYPTIRRHMSQVCTFEKLDSWEDEVACPESFCTPAPLPGSSISGHSDWI